MAQPARRRKTTNDDGEPPYIEPVLPSLDESLRLGAEIARHNYADLVRLYYRNTQAPLAVKTYKDRASRKLKRNLHVILRDHRQRTIVEDDEIEWREAFDNLLTCYSILELALQARYITGLSRPMQRQALQILEHPAVRAYYETHYPLLLPQLFRIRLSTGKAHEGHAGPRQLTALQRTIELDRQLMARHDVVAFLTLADDFWVDGFERADLLKAVSDPASLVTHMTRRGRKQTYLDQAVVGLLKFLQLCEGLEHVLRSVEGDATFQSGIWHLFGYWFADRREAVVPTLRRMIKEMQKAAVALPEAVALATPQQAQQLLDCVDDLASTRYSRPLRNVLRSFART